MANETTGLLRPHYFERQQLRAADLTAAQAYVRERLRRHNRFLHGWGVVCGARVARASSEGPWALSIREGYAVTPRGDEVYIPAGTTFNVEPGVEECLGIPPPCPDPEELGEVAEGESPIRVVRANIDPPGKDVGRNYNDEWVDLLVLEETDLDGYVLRHVTNPGTPDEGRETYYTFRESAPFEAGTVVRVHSGAQRHHEEPMPEIAHRYRADPGEVGNWRLNNIGDTIFVLNAGGQRVTSASFLPEALVPIGEGIVYLVACPADEPRAPRPAVPADCQPGGGVYEYSRMCETVQFRIVCELPPSHREEPLSCEALEEIVCGRAHVPCPPGVDADDNCVVLARITVGGDSVLQIDDLSERRQLLSESLLLAYQRCRCETAEPPTAAFVAEPDAGTAPLSVDFRDESSGEIVTWAWSFGDGGTSSQQNPSHTYQEPGTYTATLTVAGPGGTATASGTVRVRPERSILRIDPGLIRGSQTVRTGHHVSIFGQGLADATDVEFANSAGAIAGVAIIGRSSSRLQLRVVLEENPDRGERPFTISFPDGTELFSRSVRLDIGVQIIPLREGEEVITVELDEAEFDLERGREEPVEEIDGIGGVRGGRLREAGAGNLLALVTLPPERTAEIAGVSVEVATRWRDAAREELRR